MTVKRIQRRYNCRNEELPVIGGYLLTSLKRDGRLFGVYSPKYNDEGIKQFGVKVNTVNNMINPKAGMAGRKLITEELYMKMDSVADKSNHIEGYILMSKGAVPLSVKDFGITALRQRIKARDAEGTLDNLKIVNLNIAKYNNALMAVGLNSELISFFSDAATTISQLNISQYDAGNEHKNSVLESISVMNDLYSCIMEICKIGKILFKSSPDKLGEYTFNTLRKRVRLVHGNHQRNEDDSATGASRDE